MRSLSTEQSATMIERLANFYIDIHSMLEPILPPDNPAMALLSSPLPPTSSPLRSARNDLRIILEQLRKVCAPVRDDEVDAAIQSTYSMEGDEDLPAIVTQTLRSTMHLIEEMRSDLRSFTLANLEEETLTRVLTAEARRREVLLVARLYGGEQGVTKPWVDWISSPLALVSRTAGSNDSPSARSTAWIPLVMKALSSSTPVSIVYPPMTENPPEPEGSPRPPPQVDARTRDLILPPPFLIPLPSLFRIQDLMQALVVTACLRIIAQSILPRITAAPPSTLNSRTLASSSQMPPRRPGTPNVSSPSTSRPIRPTSSPGPKANLSTGSPTPTALDPLDEFTSRVWSLVEHEVERGGRAEAETKLINLEDEVWRLKKQFIIPGSSTSLSPAQINEEKRIRAQVQHLLRLDDKVFTLLQTRLVHGLTEWLTTAFAPSSAASVSVSVSGQAKPKSHAQPSGISTPVHMRTGMRRPGTLLATSPSWGSDAVEGGLHVPAISSLPTIAGFDGVVLRKALGEVAHDLAVVVGWVKETWGGVIALAPRPAETSAAGTGVNSASMPPNTASSESTTTTGGLRPSASAERLAAGENPPPSSKSPQRRS